MFKWKDRSGAVRQAAWEYAQSVKQTQEMIDGLSEKEIDEYKKTFRVEDPNWEMKVNVDGIFEGSVSLVLGTGSRYVNYFCIDPDYIPDKTLARFKNEVRDRIRHNEEYDSSRN